MFVSFLLPLRFDTYFLKDIWVTQKGPPKCFTVKSKRISLRNHVLIRYSTVVKYILCSTVFCVANVTTALNFVFWTNTKYWIPLWYGPFLLIIALSLITAIYGRTVQSSIETTSRPKVCWGILFCKYEHVIVLMFLILLP